MDTYADDLAELMEKLDIHDAVARRVFHQQSGEAKVVRMSGVTAAGGSKRFAYSSTRFRRSC